MDITKAFQLLLSFEGGLSNNSSDKGGLTKYGISHAAYPDIDIASLTTDMAKEIYEQDYWNKCHCSELPSELQYIVFDTAVNIGITAAVKMLQEAAGVTIDGIIGAETIAKSLSVQPAEYLLYRLARYVQIVENDPTQHIFLKGWTSRVIKLLQMSKAGQLA